MKAFVDHTLRALPEPLNKVGPRFGPGFDRLRARPAAAGVFEPASRRAVARRG
jgi:hypothetical protein